MSTGILASEKPLEEGRQCPWATDKAAWIKVLIWISLQLGTLRIDNFNSFFLLFIVEHKAAKEVTMIKAFFK